VVHKVVNVQVTFTNPLPEVVTDCVLRAEGSGLLKEQLRIKYVNAIWLITPSLWWETWNESGFFKRFYQPHDFCLQQPWTKYNHVRTLHTLVGAFYTSFGKL